MKQALVAAAIGCAALLLAGAAAAPAYHWVLPPGAVPPPVPADNPMSEAKVALGRRLFYDADLSADGTMACGACHETFHALGDGQKTRGGVTGEAGRRNPMSLANVGYYRSLTWGDPGLGRLEDQAFVPLTGTHPVEMGMGGRTGAIGERLAPDACYRKLFTAAFPETNGEIGMATVTKALAAFERTLVSMDSAYDRYERGDRTALDETQRRGMALFFGTKLGCASCHAAPLFNDAGAKNPVAAFHNIGLHDPYPASDLGLAEITGRAEDAGKYRTPTLRNIAVTAPYMHDGSVASLPEAIRAHFAGSPPLRDVRLKEHTITDAEIGDLVAFLGALTDKGFLEDRRFALPKPECPI